MSLKVDFGTHATEGWTGWADVTASHNYRCEKGHEHKIQPDQYTVTFRDGDGSSITTKNFCPTCLSRMLDSVSMRRSDGATNSTDSE